MKSDELTGTRHRITYRGEPYYFNVFPGEVFISSVEEKDQLTAAALDAMSRIVSMALKTNTVDEVITQLKKASRSDKDLPGILSRILDDEHEGWEE